MVIRILTVCCISFNYFKSIIMSIYIWERSGSVVERLTEGPGDEPHRLHCVVSLSKNINPSLVLVLPRKTRPFITEMGKISFLFVFGYIILRGRGKSPLPLDIFASYIPYIKSFYIALLSYAIAYM